MKKLITLFISSCLSLMAQYTTLPIDQKIIDSKIKIIDIRTPSEWKTTGILKGSIPIMFFNEQGGYDMDGFLNQLNKHIKKGEKFALICNSGSRTQIVGTYLGTKLGYNVVDLQGGIIGVISKKIPLEAYKSKP